MSARESVNDVDRIIGRRVFNRRRELRLSEEALAHLLTVSVSEVRAIEEGRAKIYASTLFLISTALGASIRDLLPTSLN